MKVLPLYLPHQGCAHQCVYCNQPLVVGPGEDRRVWRERLESFSPKAPSRNSRDEWEIAFFGGTFSALEPAVMRDCLQLAAPYAQREGILGIRISTRPDKVPDDILAFLKNSGVRTIELGLESLDDVVLRKSARGHTAEDARDACRRIRQHGFILGIHLMCGLPGQTEESFRQTVDEAVTLQPNLVRLAPTLVLKGTPLETLYRRGDYQPQTLEDAIRQCTYAYRAFYHRGIDIARVGLALSDIEGEGAHKRIAGPWHPALRHEIESRIVRQTIAERLGREEGKKSRIFVNPKDISIVLGAGKANLFDWKEKLGWIIELKQDENQPRHTARLASGETLHLLDSSRESSS